MQRSEPPRIAGYRDLVRVASGGFSTVYTAFQEALARTVAVKILHADAHDPAARQRFQHECELLGRLTGQANIINVFAAGTTEDQRFFIAMQYLPRGSLAERLAASGPLPAAEVLRIGVSVAGGLQAAHAAGILHRDIKPGNILIADSGEPVLSDFGIASLITPAGPGSTVDAFTRGHTAPELIGGQPPSVRTDIYAVGSTLYTLLVGVAPATDSAGLAGLNTHAVPQDLAALLRRTLAPDPEQRPATAAQLAVELTLALGSEPTPAPAAVPTAVPGGEAGAPPVAAVGSAAPPPPEELTRLRTERMIPAAKVSDRRRGRRRKMVVAAVIALTTAGAAFAVTLGRSSSAVPVAEHSSVAPSNDHSSAPPPAPTPTQGPTPSVRPRASSIAAPAPGPTGHPTPSPTGSPQPPAAAYWTFSSAYLAGCLTASATNGTVFAAACQSWQAQDWQTTGAAIGAQHQFKSRSRSLCLTTDNKTDRNAVWLATCATGMIGQYWSYDQSSKRLLADIRLVGSNGANSVRVSPGYTSIFTSFPTHDADVGISVHTHEWLATTHP